jgi:DNA-binding MarR family transcriptional regulator
MSKRLLELGAVWARDRKPGYGLLENPFNPMDRRLRMIKLSAKGRALVAQIAGMAGVMPAASGDTSLLAGIEVWIRVSPRMINL